MAEVTVPIRYVFDGPDFVDVFVDAWDPDCSVMWSVSDVPPDVMMAYDGVSDTVITEAVVNLDAVHPCDVIVSFGEVLSPVSDDEFYGLFNS